MAGMDEHHGNGNPETRDLSEAAARRRFLKNCAKFAAGMPPAVTLLMHAARVSAQDADALESELEDSVLANSPPGGGPPGCSLGAPPVEDNNPNCD